MKFCFYRHPQIPWRIPCVWQKTQQVWYQNHASFFYKKKELWLCWRLFSYSLKYTPLEHYLYLTGVTNCHKRISVSVCILTSSAKKEQFEFLTALHNSFMKAMKRSSPRNDPCGITDNTSYGVESALRWDIWDGVLVK